MIRKNDKMLTNFKEMEYTKHQPNPIIAYYNEFIGTPRLYKEKCATFQMVTKYTILIGQWFGLNPVEGISEIDTTKLRFSFYSARSIYSMFSIIAQCTFATFCFLKSFVETDSSLASNTSLIFYSTSCLTTIFFFQIATKWPALCTLISKIEASDPLTDVKLVRKCNLSCLVILSLALIEHLLADIGGIANALDCHPDDDLYEVFSVTSFPWIFTFINYHPFVGFISQFINIQCTFNWNFADVFVIIISFYLKSRLDQVNRRIVNNSGKEMPPSFWRLMREDYTRVTYLVKQVDGVISGLVFVTFANNLYFICLQLLHMLAQGVMDAPSCKDNSEDLRPFQGYEPTIYFIYSFIFLVVRSVAVSTIAAQVHTASKESSQALYEVPSEAYCVEVQRLLDQIHGSTVALSGLQFFYIKRGLVLSIAGTIVTYELVLMQMTGITPTTAPPVTSN